MMKIRLVKIHVCKTEKKAVALSILTTASTAPYTAIAPPTPDTPSVGFTMYLVNSALKLIKFEVCYKNTSAAHNRERTIKK